MRHTHKLYLFIALIFGAFHTQSAPVIYDGVTFPEGDSSFVDSIIEYLPGTDVDISSIYAVPQNMLGAPDNASVSIGDYATDTNGMGIAGIIIARFLDNALIADGTAQEDLWVFEIGPAIEWFNLEISTNGSDWLFIGNLRGQPSGVDIDSVVGIDVNAEYTWVRVSDDPSRNQSGSPFGEGDFDAIGAISSRAITSTPPPVTTPVNAPASLGLLLLGLGVAHMQRRKSLSIKANR